MVSIIPVLSKIHENMYATIYNNKVACNTIRKLSITDIKGQVNNRNDYSVKVEISLKEAAPHDLDITVFGQGYGKYIFKSNPDGNMIQFFEYKVVEDNNSKKLNEVTYRESKSRKIK